jgi:hypothetical protein
MTDPSRAPDHYRNRTQRRRRRQDKPPISARLVLDDHVKGDVGILSDDLFADLFPYLQHHGIDSTLSCYLGSYSNQMQSLTRLTKTTTPKFTM